MRPDRVAFTLFGIDVMWYGILIAFGIGIGMILALRRAPKYELTADTVLNFLLVCIPAGIIGARLYYVIFNWDQYADNLMNIFNTRSGGLAVHGGLILGIAAALICCKIWKVKPLKGLDLVAPSFAIAQSIGRWGNYINGEAHGGPTDLPWAIQVGGEMVHPTFLYESIWTFLLFLFLMWLSNHQKFSGQIFYLYCILYSFERFFVEGLRTDSLMIGGLKTAQLLSLTLIVIFTVAYLYAYTRYKKENKDTIGG